MTRRFLPSREPEPGRARKESGIAEDVLVYGKVAILVGICGVGFARVRPEEALPVFEGNPMGVLGAAALLFVAYEGFQLLTYDYADLEAPHKNLPRAIWISVPAVTLLYMVVAFVTTGALTDEAIQGQSETVLALVAQPVLGRAGVLAVLVAAVVQYAGRLHEITSFSSFVFLLVFAAVNVAALIHREFAGWGRMLPILGGSGCLAAAVVLAWGQYQESPGLTWGLLGVSLAIVALRVGYRAIGHRGS